MKTQSDPRRIYFRINNNKYIFYESIKNSKVYFSLYNDSTLFKKVFLYLRLRIALSFTAINNVFVILFSPEFKKIDDSIKRYLPLLEGVNNFYITNKSGRNIFQYNCAKTIHFIKTFSSETDYITELEGYDYITNFTSNNPVSRHGVFLTENYIHLEYDFSNFDRKIKDVMCYEDYFNFNSKYKAYTSVNFYSYITGLGYQDKDHSILKIIKNTLVNKNIKCTNSHGDLASWNIVNIGEKYYIYDWEFYSKERPILFDFLHYVFSETVINSNENSDSISKYLLFLIYDIKHRKIFKLYNIYNLETYIYYLTVFLCEKYARQLSENNNTDIIKKIIKSVLEIYEKYNSEKKLNILVSAYACDKRHGSEPGVGWNVINALSKTNHTFWVLTKENNNEILNNEDFENVNFIFVKVPEYLNEIKKKTKCIRLYYYIWQFYAYKASKDLMEKQSIDIGHHITFVNDWTWSCFSLLNINYVWGPVGSHPKLPSALCKEKNIYIKNKILYSLKCLIRYIDPLLILTCLRSRYIIKIDPNTKNYFWKLFDKKILNYPAIGVENLESFKKQEYGDATKEIVFAGRLTQIKNPLLVLEVFNELRKKKSDIILTLVGDGELRQDIEKYLYRNNLNDLVKVTGWLSRKDTLDIISNADVFFFPSAEAGGMVALEAVELGVPVIGLKYGGVGSILSEEVGRFIDVEDKDYEIIKNELIDALSDLCINDKISKDTLHTYSIKYLRWENKVKPYRLLYS